MTKGTNMSKTIINTLILDDIKCIGEKIEERIIICDKKYQDELLSINPWYYQFRLRKPEEESFNELKKLILQHNISYIVSDRRFVQVVGSSYKADFPNLDYENKIYSDNRKKEKQFSEEVIGKLLEDSSIFNLIKGIIVYTYSIEQSHPDVVRKQFLSHLPQQFREEDLMIVETNSEIYNRAGLTLHKFKEADEYKGIYLHGDKKDFMLYGLFIGEMAYNQIRFHSFGTRVRSIERFKSSFLRIYLISYFLFVTLNISANLLSNYLAGDYQAQIGISLFIFGFLIPSAIIWLKPELFLIVDSKS